MHTFLLAPTSFGVGLTSVSLGMVQVLQNAGLKVGFLKPIAQPHPSESGAERVSQLMASLYNTEQPASLSLAHVERMVGTGQIDELMEEIVAMHQDMAE